MCWVMPPASPETTLVLRMASSSEVLPWSTWPMMVTTGGRDWRLPSSSPEASVITSSTSDSETRTTLWPNSSTMRVAVSGSMVWFCVAMMPFCISTFTTAATRSAMRLASSCTVMASGTLTSRTTFSRSPEWLCTRRFSRSWRRFIAAMERWRPSSSVALAMVSLPERRRSSSPLARPRFSSTAGTFSTTSSTSARSGGRPRRARPGPARRRGRSPRPGRPGAARRALARWAARASSSAFSAAAAAARCSWISRSFSARSAASFSARRRASSASRASAASRSRSRRSLSCALAASTAFSRRSNSASERLGVVPTRAGPWPLAGAPGFGTRIRLRLCSTVTDLVRPWLKLWRTWLVSVPPPRSPSVLPLPVPSLLSIIPSLAFPAGAFPRQSVRPGLRRRRSHRHVPDA